MIFLQLGLILEDYFNAIEQKHPNIWASGLLWPSGTNLEIKYTIRYFQFGRYFVGTEEYC